MSFIVFIHIYIECGVASIPNPTIHSWESKSFWLLPAGYIEVYDTNSIIYPVGTHTHIPYKHLMIGYKENQGINFTFGYRIINQTGINMTIPMYVYM